MWEVVGGNETEEISNSNTVMRPDVYLSISLNMHTKVGDIREVCDIQPQAMSLILFLRVI